MLMITGAPAFAEGPNRPSTSTALPGTWRPRAGAIADFGHAIATRYSGRFGNLPRVGLYQLWAEPNLAINLAPQRKRRRLVSGLHYRRMLRAFYAGVRGVSSGYRVVTGGTAPYGDLHPKGRPLYARTQPVAFWRQVLCLKGERLRKMRCRKRARFDIFSHHPINIGRPTRHAINALDVSTPDIGKLRRVVRRAVRTGRAKPRKGKPFWATELWWNSNPPSRHGVRLGKHARWLQQGLYVLWHQKVKAVIWFEITDYPASPGTFTPQSGLFLENGTAKPAYYAYRFPFVGDRIARKRVRVWGKAPSPGRVLIERLRRGKWRRVRGLRAGRNRIFVGKIRLGGRARLRARKGSETSLVWVQR